MSEGQLSQDEIDALLEGASDFNFNGDDDSGGDLGGLGDTDFASILTDDKPNKEKKDSSKKSKSPATSSVKNSLYSLDNENMELLLDVNMTLTVELGRTKKSIKEVLAYGEGSIVELDNLNGEPVDILVNGRLIARGEIVVIDENYGVNITEIIDPESRFSRLR